MNLLLSPHSNVNDPVWSVILSVIIVVVMTVAYVVYIIKLSYTELSDGRTDTTKQEVLLQLPSDGD
jgi:hypothetical protein